MQSADEHRRELQTDSVLAACTFAKGVGLPCCLKNLQERIQAEFGNNVVCELKGGPPQSLLMRMNGTRVSARVYASGRATFAHAKDESEARTAACKYASVISQLGSGLNHVKDYAGDFKVTCGTLYCVY